MSKSDLDSSPLPCNTIDIEHLPRHQATTSSNEMVIQQPGPIQDDFILRITKEKTDVVKHNIFKSIKKFNQSAVQKDSYSDYLYIYSQVSRSINGCANMFITSNPADSTTNEVTFESQLMKVNSSIQGRKSFNSKIITKYMYGGVRTMLVMPDNTHFFVKQTSIFSTNVKKEIYKDLQGNGNPQLIGDVERQNCSCCLGGKDASKHGHIIRFYKGMIEEDMIPLMIALENIDLTFRFLPTVIFTSIVELILIVLLQFVSVKGIPLFVSIGVLCGLLFIAIIVHSLFIGF